MGSEMCIRDRVNRLSVYASSGAHLGDVDLSQAVYAPYFVLRGDSLFYLYVDTGGSTRSPEDIVSSVYKVPPFGDVVDYQLIPSDPDLWVGDSTLENRWYRVQIDPATGGLASWYDKELDRELIDEQSPWKLGQYVYEWIDSPADRGTIFAFNYDDEDFGSRFKDTPFRRQGPSKVEVMQSRLEPGSVFVEVRIEGLGIRGGRVRYTLPSHEKALNIDYVLDKEYNTLAEAVYIPFPFALDKPKFHLDLNLSLIHI